MKPKNILAVLFLLVGLVACQQESRYLNEAETLYQQGREQLADKQSEAAAESFSQALLAVNRCNQDRPEVKRLKGQIEDDLGTRYWKHGLFEEALPLHADAVSLFEDINDSVLLATALRNYGRVTASMGNIEAAQGHYDAALTLAKTLKNKAIEKEILIE